MIVQRENNFMEKKVLYILAFVRSRDLQIIYGVSRQTVWRYVRDGKLEPPKRVSPGVTGWDRATLDEFFGINNK